MSNARLRPALVLLKASAALGLVAVIVAVAGPKYAIRQIPPDQLRQMSDTDWIGVGWIVGAGGVMAIACLLALVALGLWLRPYKE